MQGKNRKVQSYTNGNKDIDSDETSSADEEDLEAEKADEVNESMISFDRQFKGREQTRGSLCANMKHFKNLKKIKNINSIYLFGA
jgi:hypothetical protein